MNQATTVILVIIDPKYSRARSWGMQYLNMSSALWLAVLTRSVNAKPVTGCCVQVLISAGTNTAMLHPADISTWPRPSLRSSLQLALQPRSTKKSHPRSYLRPYSSNTSYSSSYCSAGTHTTIDEPYTKATAVKRHKVYTHIHTEEQVKCCTYMHQHMNPDKKNIHVILYHIILKLFFFLTDAHKSVFLSTHTGYARDMIIPHPCTFLSQSHNSPDTWQRARTGEF